MPTDNSDQSLPVDPDHALHWVGVAHSARISFHVLNHVPEPANQSNLALVDALYPDELASAWCRGFLSAGLEHLIFWADQVAPLKFHDEAVISHRLRPAQALARAAAESAAQAIWILAAGNPHACARRRLTLVLHDLEEQTKASSGEEQLRLRGRRESLLQELSNVTDIKGLQRPPSYMNLIRAASAEVIEHSSASSSLTTADDAERVWRGTAGAMHGKHWPSLVQTLTIREPSGRLRRYPDPRAITDALALARELTAYGVLRYADYCGWSASLPALLAGATTHLAARIPLKDGASLDPALFATTRLREEMDSDLPRT